MPPRNAPARPAAASRSKAVEQTRKAIIAELRHFRATVHQALVSFQQRTEGEIQTVIDLFTNKTIGVTDAEMAEHRKAADEMVSMLKRIKLKANKGRRKDIRRIEEMIDALREKTDAIT
ncbi:MAG TPA: hypothetical protein P5287_05695 [bacterium]|nr:hypothetical protein [bacterium]